MLGRVADRVAHVVQAALVDQVDDQLQFVQALEVGDFRLVARLDERLESGLDERADAAAQHRLLAEQIGFGFFGERRLDDARARDADALGVRQRQRAAPGRWRPDGSANSAGVPAPSTYSSRTRWPGDFGATIVTSTSGADRDGAEADVEAVREHQHVAGREVRLDRVLVELRRRRVGHEHHDRRRPTSRPPPTSPTSGRPPAPCARERLVAGSPTRTLHAAVLQVQRVRVALRSVADDRDLLALNQAADRRPSS